MPEISDDGYSDCCGLYCLNNIGGYSARQCLDVIEEYMDDWLANRNAIPVACNYTCSEFYSSYSYSLGRYQHDYNKCPVCIKMFKNAYAIYETRKKNPQWGGIILFTDVIKYKNSKKKQVTSTGEKLAAYIKKFHLGKVAASGTTENSNSENTIQGWLWIPDYKKLKRHLEVLDERGKRKGRARVSSRKNNDKVPRSVEA